MFESNGWQESKKKCKKVVKGRNVEDAMAVSKQNKAVSASGEFHPDLECGEGAELQRQRVGRLQISLRGQDLTLGSQATEAHVSVLMYRCVSLIVCRL